MAPTTPPSPTEPHPSESDGEKKEQDLSIHPSDDPKLESNHVLGPEIIDSSEPEILDSSVSQEDEWISGMRLFTIMAAVTIVCFLMLLDISIIVTVQIKAPSFVLSCLLLRLCHHRPFPESRANSTLSLMLAGTAVHTNLQGTMSSQIQRLAR
jgi:hypothetical protein